MIRSIRSVGGRFFTCTAWLLMLGGSGAGAEDVYFRRNVSELTLTEGRLPEEAKPGVIDFGRDWRLRSATVAYAVIEGAGEVFLDLPSGRQNLPGQVTPLSGGDVVAFRIPERRRIRGRLFAPEADGKGMVAIAFEVEPPPAQDDARAVFALAKRHHYERLINRDLPGAEWFRHQARAAEALAPPANRRPDLARGRGDDLERTFALFSGGRAVDENLQLDRQAIEAAVPKDAAKPQPAPKPVKADAIKGITVAEMDWSARIKGKTPAIDPLASRIPADQHAVFLPSLGAAAALLSEFHGDAIPLMRLAEGRSEDTRVQRHYERQLGVSLSEMLKFPGLGMVKGLALTGSDPYFPSGTDVAILVETDAPDVLAAFLKAHVEAARKATPDAKEAAGEVDGVRYTEARSADRSLSSYVAVIDKAVVLTNSPVQLARLVDAAHGKVPALAGLPEYTFFRDRYPRAKDGDESAFLVLTDAAIRRWCGPRWRIGSSRRVRAAAALAEVQADSIDRIVTETTGGATPAASPDSIDLGPLSLGRSGVRSEIYGTLDFQTPIAELSLDEVEQGEADAYSRWRDGYQQNWRGVFDPIAARLSVRPDRLSADVTIMPLIVNTEYRTFMDLVGKARIAPDAGDRHAGTLLHAAMALDLQSKLAVQGRDMVANMTRVPQAVALGWLGSSASVYVDDDPFWADLAAAENPREFLEKQINRLPVALQAEVTDGAKLALFLAGLRAFVDQSAPNLIVWENREHKGQRYVRVAEAENARPGGGPKLAVHYYASPRSLTLSPNEDVVKRAIERQVAKAEAGDKPAAWLGESLALRVGPRGFEVLGHSAKSDLRAELQVRSWNNLPILNEWKRLFPDRDPVAVHRAVWGATLIDPGGGRYVWNPRWSTMESTVLGHPGEPRTSNDPENPARRFHSAGLGLDFEGGGLRARTEVILRQRP